MKKGLVAIALASVLLSGCVISIDDDNDNRHTSWDQIEKQNRQKISDLSAGTDIARVRSNMGTPDFDELLMKDGKQYRILFYRTQRTKGDGHTTKDECTPILFVDDKLVGFGQTALEAI